MYYFFEIETPDGVVRHIVLSTGERSAITFPDVDGNNGPERQQYLEWLAEGNTPEPWEATNGPV